ncbi:hypothetical protein D623_10019758 [Myotis brandtii]|uniref:Uncharacterized protein n=1 Tax=Myotis brandtii TaxID=109478 RepID=S7QCR6_MYOBR|nr:hypothetical protein D623_10019758 [Myotis brandtii]
MAPRDGLEGFSAPSENLHLTILSPQPRPVLPPAYLSRHLPPGSLALVVLPLRIHPVSAHTC